MSETISATGRVLAGQGLPGGYSLLRVATDIAVLQPGHAPRVGAEFWPVQQAAPAQGWIEWEPACWRFNALPPASGIWDQVCRNELLFWA